MSGSRPKVSVIIPTYNRPKLLREAVESILAQSYGDFEIILVDDCSDEHSSVVISSISETDGRVRFVRTRSNLGCNGARNVGLDETQSPYVAFLDDDDVALPHRLESGVNMLEEDGAIDLVCCRYGFMNLEGERLADGGPDFVSESGLLDSDWLFEGLYCDWLWLPTSTLMFRRSALNRFRYPPIRRSDGDSMLMSQLAATGHSFYVIDEVGTLMRRDNRHRFMSRDRGKLLSARRETLAFIRAWLADEGIARFDHLHGRAWAEQLAKEAAYHGGLKGLGLAFGAAFSEPSFRHLGRHLASIVRRRFRLAVG